MKSNKANLLSVVIAGIVAGSPSLANAEAASISEAIGGGKVSLDLNLRHEEVDQPKGDNAAVKADAKALTLRTRMGYTTDSFKGFSYTLSFEDVSVVGGTDKYKAPPAGLDGPADTAVIADAEVTEIDQSFLQYKGGMFTATLGQQVIALDNQRFVGHVGWRQDRQTFDALRVVVTPVEKLTVDASYVNRRHRIFAEVADINSKDILLNVGYQFGCGKLTGYSYMLEEDQPGAVDNGIDTLGLRFAGSTMAGETKILYTGEFAKQTNELEGRDDFDTSYMFLEAGAEISGFTAKLGYEVLGSDDGMGGFATPLATAHAFNGWADMFLGTPDLGLVDTYVSLGAKVLGGGLTVVYHDFSADESTDDVDDLGDEIDVVYAKGFAKHYKAGIKFAQYSLGDVYGKLRDTDKTWLWINASF